MKKILLLSILFLFFTVGCTKYKDVSYKGISFKYPDSMTLSYNDAKLYDGDNIDIEVSTVPEFMAGCARNDQEYGRNEYGKAYDGYVSTLKYLRDKGVNAYVDGLTTLTCGWGEHNISSKFINIDGVNGVVYSKVNGDSGLPDLKSFLKQILLVTPQDKVYSIVFNYQFGELGDPKHKG